MTPVPSMSSSPVAETLEPRQILLEQSQSDRFAGSRSALGFPSGDPYRGVRGREVCIAAPPTIWTTAPEGWQVGAGGRITKKSISRPVPAIPPAIRSQQRFQVRRLINARTSMVADDGLWLTQSSCRSSVAG